MSRNTYVKIHRYADQNYAINNCRSGRVRTAHAARPAMSVAKLQRTTYVVRGEISAIGNCGRRSRLRVRFSSSQ